MRVLIVRTLGMATFVASVVAWGGVLLARQQVPAAAVFTTQQATAGKIAYAKNCASCHMPDLSGNAEIPPLAGTAFMTTWGARTTKELFDYMSAAMPYGGPTLKVEDYTVITAYILQANGAIAGEEEFTAATAVAMGTLKPAHSTAIR